MKGYEDKSWHMAVAMPSNIILMNGEVDMIENYWKPFYNVLAMELLQSCTKLLKWFMRW